MQAVFTKYPAPSFDNETDYCMWVFFESPAEYMDNSLGRTDRHQCSFSHLSWSSIFYLYNS
jgi:hypothetical protein